MNQAKQKPWVVGITGSSGVVYGLCLVRALAETGREIALTVTDAARIVMREELGLETPPLEQPDFPNALFSKEVLDRVRYFHYKDLLAPISSGSFPTAGMIVMPCSMSSLSQIANGASQNLLERAADVTLKEKRRLVLVPRETPFSAVHLENMLKLSRLGVDIVPANPGFYARPQKIDDLINFVVGKVLDLVGIETELFQRWKGSPETTESGAEAGKAAPR
ncbi:MAG: UbiX family flavin prenyltransferase [Candidatus Omnitrophica bacterium]|nr:UbiX family flavin prenyltransferase [Candidatus Omnitrophota bacterium]